MRNLGEVQRRGAAEGKFVDKVRVVQDLWHAWNTGIHDEVLAYVHEDVVIRPLEVTFNTYVGLEAADGLRLDLEREGIKIASTPFTWEQHGDDVLVQGRSRVDLRGHVGDGEWCWLFRFDDAKVRLIQTFPDREQAHEFSSQAQRRA